MRNRVTLTFGLAIAMAIAACLPRASDYSSWPPLGADSSVDNALASIESRNPAQDARDATGRGDYSLMGVQGHALHVPGLRHWEGHARRYGVRVVQLNCEMLDDRARRYCGPATKYATEYNAIVLDRLRHKPPPN